MCSRSRTPATDRVSNETANEEVIEDLSSLRVANVDEKFNTPAHMQNVIVRHYALEWENSMVGLANFPENAAWKPLEGHHDIFQSTSRYKQGVVRRSKFRQGDLDQAILIGMKVKKVSSNFPVQLGLEVTGCKGNYYTCNGERYAYMINANENTNNLDEIIVTSSPYVNSEYLRMYPGMTKQNLRSNGIMEVPGEEYVFVDQQHPIVSRVCLTKTNHPSRVFRTTHTSFPSFPSFSKPTGRDDGRKPRSSADRPQERRFDRRSLVQGEQVGYGTLPLGARERARGEPPVDQPLQVFGEARSPVRETLGRCRRVGRECRCADA